MLALHRRAALWYEQHSLIDDALSHYLAAQDTQAAACLVEANAMLAFRRGDVHLAHEWLEALPEEAIRANLRLCFDSAWMMRCSRRLSAPGRVCDCGEIRSSRQ